MLIAVVFTRTVAHWPPGFMALILAAFLVVALWVGLKLWSEVPSRYRGPILTAFLVATVFSVHTGAVQFTQYYPCTSENWEWLLDNLYYIAALTVWYGAYGCF